MSETAPTVPPLVRSRDLHIYRPLSGLAVGAFAVAALYALVLTVLAIAAFFSGTPLFLPGWTLLIPAIALGLAVAGRQHLRYSEDTRSGEGLVKWALGLSIGFGSVYLAYYFALSLAVEMQAKDFTDDWFNRMRAGKTEEAFLFTQKPEVRRGVNTDPAAMAIRFGNARADGRPGELTAFRLADLVRIIQLGGEDMTIEKQGVRDLEYESGGYRVSQVYRVSTPEGVFETLVVVRSSQVDRKREWVVSTNEGGILTKKYTPLGQTYKKWHEDARILSNQLIEKRNNGNLPGVFLLTRPPSERVQMEKRLRAQYAAHAARSISLPIAGPFGAAGVAEAGIGTAGGAIVNEFALREAEAATLKGYPEFCEGALVRNDQLEVEKSTASREEVVEGGRRLFRPGTLVRLRPGEGTPGLFIPPVKPDDSPRFETIVDFGILPPDGDVRSVLYLTETRLVLQAPPGPITESRKPLWYVSRIDLLRIKIPSAKPGRGMPSASSAFPEAPPSGGK